MPLLPFARGRSHLCKTKCRPWCLFSHHCRPGCRSLGQTCACRRRRCSLSVARDILKVHINEIWKIDCTFSVRSFFVRRKLWEMSRVVFYCLMPVSRWLPPGSAWLAGSKKRERKRENRCLLFSLFIAFVWLGWLE